MEKTTAPDCDVNKNSNQNSIRQDRMEPSSLLKANGVLSQQSSSKDSSTLHTANGVVHKMELENEETSCESSLAKDGSSRRTFSAKTSMMHMHELYETVTEIAEEPTSNDEPDVKAFFKALKNHSFLSKIVYVTTVVSIVAVSHFALAEQWLLPYYYTIATPVLLISRLIMYWKMKYQYFMLDFCYFSNFLWYTFIWLTPSREDIFAVGFAVANGPLIWALFVFRNSLVFHSLDKVTSLYIHFLPSLMSFVIRWYPEETSKNWYKDFPHSQLGVSFVWLIAVPFGFAVSHQVFYGILVNVVLKPSEDYMILYRYVTANENSFMFRACNLLGPRFRFLLYTMWWLALTLGMLVFNLIWYNYFAAHCAILITFLLIAFFNGSTYYIDVFRLHGSSKNKTAEIEAPVAEKAIEPAAEKSIVIANGTAETPSTVTYCTDEGSANRAYGSVV